MQRQIEFRGKRIDNGEWVYGYLFQIWERVYILWGTTNDVPNMIEVDPSTVGQFTGIVDKNEKKIYEGDIIKIFGNITNPKTKELIPYVSVAIVKFSDNTGCFLYRIIDSSVWSNFRYTKSDGLSFEVINNIFDKEN